MKVTSNLVEFRITKLSDIVIAQLLMEGVHVGTEGSGSIVCSYRVTNPSLRSLIYLAYQGCNDWLVWFGGCFDRNGPP